jgi:hypothetical protein
MGLQSPAKQDFTSLAQTRLVSHHARRGQLDRLAQLLHPGERVVTLGDGIFRSSEHERQGLLVLTDERLMCIERDASQKELLEFELAAITSLASGIACGSGDAARGELMLVSGGVTTHVARIRPPECAVEIAAHVAGGG